MKTSDFFSRLDDYLRAIGVVAVACVLSAVLMGAMALSRSEDIMAVSVVNASSTTASLALSTTTAPPRDTRQNEVCWRNMGTDPTAFLYIATFSTVDENTYGWPVAGTEKECHDWGPNIPLYVWVGDAGAATTMKLMYSR